MRYAWIAVVLAACTSKDGWGPADLTLNGAGWLTAATFMPYKQRSGTGWLAPLATVGWAVELNLLAPGTPCTAQDGELELLLLDSDQEQPSQRDIQLDQGTTMFASVAATGSGTLSISDSASDELRATLHVVAVDASGTSLVIDGTLDAYRCGSWSRDQ